MQKKIIITVGNFNQKILDFKASLQKKMSEERSKYATYTNREGKSIEVNSSADCFGALYFWIKYCGKEFTGFAIALVVIVTIFLVIGVISTSFALAIVNSDGTSNASTSQQFKTAFWALNLTALIGCVVSIGFVTIGGGYYINQLNEQREQDASKEKRSKSEQ